MNPSRLKVLIGCECSGVVRRAFRECGHNAWSCDLKPAEDGSSFHFQRNVLEVLDLEWDLAIMHPECTFLCNSSVGCLTRERKNPSPGKLYGQKRMEAMKEAALFFKTLLNCGIPKLAIENPVMHGYALEIIGERHTQTIQPYEFGDDASKRTCLWLCGLPALRATQKVLPRYVDGKPRWGNQTDGGQNKLPPSATRAADRARTYPGIARAMALQWGCNKIV